MRAVKLCFLFLVRRVEEWMPWENVEAMLGRRRELA